MVKGCRSIPSLLIPWLHYTHIKYVDVWFSKGKGIGNQYNHLLGAFKNPDEKTYCLQKYTYITLHICLPSLHHPRLSLFRGCFDGLAEAEMHVLYHLVALSPSSTVLHCAWTLFGYHARTPWQLALRGQSYNNLNDGLAKLRLEDCITLHGDGSTKNQRQFDARSTVYMYDGLATSKKHAASPLSPFCMVYMGMFTKLKLETEAAADVM